MPNVSEWGPFSREWCQLVISKLESVEERVGKLEELSTQSRIELARLGMNMGSGEKVESRIKGVETRVRVLELDSSRAKGIAAALGAVAGFVVAFAKQIATGVAAVFK